MSRRDYVLVSVDLFIVDKHTTHGKLMVTTITVPTVVTVTVAKIEYVPNYNLPTIIKSHALACVYNTYDLKLKFFFVN